MSTIEEKAVVEMLKPTAGLVSAVLKPWVERIDKWSNEKELKEELQPDKLAKNLETYFTCLANQVSKMTSVIFPQAQLSMDREYEPLELVKRSKYSQEPEKFDLVAAALKPENISKSYIIIDDAGMGKSTYAKFLVGQLLHKSNRIPVLIELRNLDTDLSIAENIAIQLDVPGCSFPRELFHRLLFEGRFNIILDGFDEVAITTQSKLAQDIAAFAAKNTKNVLVLTSRKQDLLPDLVDNVTLSFSELNLEQVRSLCDRYDRFSRLDVGSRLMKEVKVVPEKFLQTPLLVSLVYQTFGVNNSIAEGICSFYADVYDALYKGHDLKNKSGFVREKRSKLDFMDFQRLLGAFSFYFLIKKGPKVLDTTGAIELIETASSKVGIESNIAEKFLEDLISAVPLMIKEGREIKFLHKTIAEYFAAQYLVSHPRSAELMGRLFLNDTKYAFDKVAEFVLELNPNLFDEAITKGVAKHILEYPLNNMDERFLSTICFKSRAFIGLTYDENIERFINDIMNMLNISGAHWNVSEVRLGDGNEAYLLIGLEECLLLNYEQLTLQRLSGQFNIIGIGDDIIELDEWPEGYELETGYELTIENIPLFAYLVKPSNLNISGLVNKIVAKQMVVSSDKCKKLLRKLEDARKLEDELNDFL